jgi:hypothetical protein
MHTIKAIIWTLSIIRPMTLSEVGALCSPVDPTLHFSILISLSPSLNTATTLAEVGDLKSLIP